MHLPKGTRFRLSLASGENRWLSGLCSGARPQILNKVHYRRIGFDTIVPICVDEDRRGQVTAVESNVGEIERFVNSSVECFGECLVAHQRYRLDVQIVEAAESENNIARTDERLRKADRTAFVNSENYWPLILEQMRQGLL